MTDSLSFTRRREDGTLDFWNPERPEDYTEACAKGRGYAAELLTLMRAEGDPTLLGDVMSAIICGGEYSGVEIGFCEAVGFRLLGLQRNNYPADRKAA